MGVLLIVGRIGTPQVSTFAPMSKSQSHRCTLFVLTRNSSGSDQ